MNTIEKIGKFFSWILIVWGIFKIIIMLLQIFIKENLLNLIWGSLLMYVNNAIKKRKVLESNHIRVTKKQ